MNELLSHVKTFLCGCNVPCKIEKYTSKTRETQLKIFLFVNKSEIPLEQSRYFKKKIGRHFWAKLIQRRKRKKDRKI